MAPLELFDLVITTPQYRLPPRSNVLHLSAALNRIDGERLATAGVAWAPRLSGLPRPFTALFVGGNSATYRLDAETAERLGASASAAVAAAGGTLLVSTSPRTPADAAEGLIKAITCRSFIYRWKAGDPDNPYHGFLALADRFIVTADSASLLVEACLMGKPVEVFSWPMRRGPVLRLQGVAMATIRESGEWRSGRHDRPTGRLGPAEAAARLRGAASRIARPRPDRRPRRERNGRAPSPG